MAGSKPMRTEFGICQRLESCAYSWFSSNAQASERTGKYYILQSEGSEGGRCHPLSTCGRQEKIKLDSNSTLVIIREALGS